MIGLGVYFRLGWGMLGTCELQNFSQEYGALGDTQIDEATGDRGKRLG